MTKLIHAFYNMDTNAVELTYNDGSVLTIDCEEVENFYDVTNGQIFCEWGGNAKNFFLLFNGLFSQKLDTLLKNMRPCFCESGSALYLRI